MMNLPRRCTSWSDGHWTLIVSHPAVKVDNHHTTPHTVHPRCLPDLPVPVGDIWEIVNVAIPPGRSLRGIALIMHSSRRRTLSRRGAVSSHTTSQIIHSRPSIVPVVPLRRGGWVGLRCDVLSAPVGNNVKCTALKDNNILSIFYYLLYVW